MKIDKGLVIAVISPLISSMTTVLKSGAVKLLNPWVVVSFTALIGGSFLFLFLLVQKKQFSLSKIRLYWKEFLVLIVSRQILGSFLFTYGIFLTEPVKAIFFTKVEPYFVLFFFWKFKNEPVHPRHLFLLFVHLAGAFLLSTNGNVMQFSSGQLGDVLIIIGMALAAYSYFSAITLSKKVGALKTNALSLLVSGLFFLPFALYFSEKNVWYLSLGWVYLFADAILFYVISLSLWFVSLTMVKAWMVSALRALGPVAGLPLAYYLFGETLQGVQVIGGTIVLFTSFLIAFEHAQWMRQKN